MLLPAACYGKCHHQRNCCKLSPYNQDCDTYDDRPNETGIYLTEQLNRFGLAYIHFVEPRVANNVDFAPRDHSHDTGVFRKVWKGTFIAAGRHAGGLCCRPSSSNKAPGMLKPTTV